LNNRPFKRRDFLLEPGHDIDIEKYRILSWFKNKKAAVYCSLMVRGVHLSDFKAVRSHGLWLCTCMVA
jgi:hypothetical protein